VCDEVLDQVDLMAVETAALNPAARLLSDPKVRVEPILDPGALEPLWLDLERRSSCSFFQSWGWIGCWLRNLPPESKPQALLVFDRAEIVGLGVLVSHPHRRHGLVRSNRLCLNETGDRTVDPITLEYNGLLTDHRLAGQAVRTSLAWLTAHLPDWDELSLGGLDDAHAQAYAGIARDLGLAVYAQDSKPYLYVCLDELRGEGNEYLSLLSRNTRYQIRRARRLYERFGPIVVEAAQDVEEAVGILEELRRLHQAYWGRRGHPGAFASSFFERFHRELIESRFGAGEIQLLRVSAGPKVVGCLYNFAKDGIVHAYQSGFDYNGASRLKPGLVSHHAAIEYNLAQGARVYDFMAGEGQHKRSLGTRTGEMTWLILQRQKALFRVEGALRSLRRRLPRPGERADDRKRLRA